MGSHCVTQAGVQWCVKGSLQPRPARTGGWFVGSFGIMGGDGDEYISADEIAKLRGTINYEVVCDLGMRLEKVYL